MDIKSDFEAVTDIQESSLGWLAGIIALGVLDQFRDDELLTLSFLAGYTALYYLAAMVIWYLTPEQEA